MYYELLKKNNTMIHFSYSNILSKMFKVIFILTRIYHKEKVSRLSSPYKVLKSVHMAIIIY